MKKSLSLFIALMSFQFMGYAYMPDQLPQVFSPDAAELGKYGKVPVNYFNGLPKIVIPLTEIHAKNYTLPVYLSYHASGNKPEQHPGWVGQGWSLHAGGCISRVIRGKKDEMIKEEDFSIWRLPDDPGYLYHAEEYQSGKRTEVSYTLGNLYDFEPDEFIICIDDINASFYITGDNKVKIVSKSDADFTVDFRMNDRADTRDGNRVLDYRFDSQYVKCYDTFIEFIVTSKDGTKYHFGGCEDAIEYSIQSRYHGEFSRFWDLTATANTWMLTKIELPDGETISFEYKRGGTPVVEVDSHHLEYVWDNGTLLDPINTYNGNEGISFYFLLPSYLKSVNCKYGDDYLIFNTSRSTQLDYDYDQSLFRERVGNNGLYEYLSPKNYYEKLNSIEFNGGGRISLNYTNNPNTRLKLNSVSINANKCGAMKYEMTYDETSLPGYYSRRTDMWGYYNYMSKHSPEEDEIRHIQYQANPRLLKAEMLTKIKYPTGGWTCFEYEPHDYSQVASQFPFELLSQSGRAGGVRIKKITDCVPGQQPNERVFSYLKQSGESSGILSGIPRYFATGRINLGSIPASETEDFMNRLVENINFFVDASKHDGVIRYVSYSEHMLNQLSDTDGNHVTYSRVTETIPGSGWTEYSYSNHDTADMLCMDMDPIVKNRNLCEDILNSPFHSLALSRGLLLNKTMRNSEGRLVAEEKYSYAQDTTDAIYSQSIYINPIYSMIFRVSYHKIFTYFPALTRKIETIFPDDDGVPVVEKTDYEYNSHRQLVRDVRSNGIKQEESLMSYSSDISAGDGVYKQMQAAGIHDRPIEKTVLRDGKVVSSSLTTYRKSGDQFVPDQYYEARLDTPRSSWQKYNGAFTSGQQAVYGAPRLTLDSYDSLGNILEATEEGGQGHRYFWDPAGLHPEASYTIRDLSGVRTARVEDVAYQKVDLSGIEEYTFEFDAERAGEFSFYLRFKKPMPSRMRGIFDGEEVFNYELPEDAGEPVKAMTNNYSTGQTDPDLYRRAVEAGHHQFKFIQTGTYQGNLVPTGSNGESWITYPIYRVEEKTDNAGTWYYNFESDGNRQGGFYSKKSWQGNKTFTQAIPSDISYTINWMELGRNGKWTCKSATFTGSKDLGGSAEAIDNVRIYPSDAAATSWTWTDNDELSSETETMGIVEKYHYDGMGRLISILDMDDNKKASYKYNYSSPDTSIPDNYLKTDLYNDVAGTEARETISYYDGLGRPWQTIRLNFWNSDMKNAPVNVYEQTDYDAAGRPFRGWLPFRTTSTLPLTSRIPEPLYPGSKLYSLVEYDGSPLARSRAEYGPGDHWHANGKAVRYGYYSNGTSPLLSCQTYSVTRPNMDNVRVSRGGAVASGSLSVKSVTDEDGLTLLTFTDMYGRTLLERRHPASGEDLDTYYVYDGMGRLSAVIPPALSKLELSNANVDKYAYLYSYDANGNCVAKKLPGCDWTYYVYDKGNRLVFAQDAEYRKKGRWLFSFTDIHGRSCVTGYCGGTLSSLRQAASGQNVVASRQGNTFGPYMGYDVSGITLTDPVILSVSYYDDYGFIESQVPSGLRTNMRYCTDFSLAKWDHVNGLLTGSAERILGEDDTNDFRWSTCYYDRKGNLIQTHVTRADGGVDIATTEFTFTGKPKRRLIRHAFGAQNAMDEYYAYTYDKWERPLTVKHRIGEDAAWTVVSDLKYDGLGRLTSDNKNGIAKLKTSYTYNVRSWTKNITGPGLTEDLFYEDKGQWGGNIARIEWSAGVGTDKFSDSYKYDGLSRLVNSTRINSLIGDHEYVNDYVYDNQGNIIKSTYRDEKVVNRSRVGCLYITELDGNSLSKEYHYDGNQLVSSRSYSAKYDRAYDLPTSVDSLISSFNYDRIGRLTKSEDNGMTEVRYNEVGYPSYIRTADDGYVQNKYTAGGARLESRRMSADGKVTTMAYEGNEVIENGKLRMLMFDGGYVDFTGSEPRYCWYTKDHLGSVRAVADAEGNVFASYAYGPYGEDFVAERTAASNVQEGVLGAQPADVPVYGGEITYVGQLRPGMSLPATTPAATYTVNENPDWQPYKFSGKESLTRVGLDLYDFGARMYSPSNMRWMTMDPLCEKYYHISPYAYCAGDPINFVDPDGKKVRIHYKDDNGKDKYVDYNGKGSHSNKFVNAVIEAYKYNKANWEAAGNSGECPSTRLVERDEICYVYEAGDYDNERTNQDAYHTFIVWGSSRGLENDGVVTSPATGFSHEADHANDMLDDPEGNKQRRRTSDSSYGNKEERRVITGSEKKTATANHEVAPGQATRTSHEGKTVIVNGVTSTTVDKKKTQEYENKVKNHNFYSSEW